MTAAARPLSGRVALVTGASRGIGRAVARGYAEAGATVIAVARTAGALEELDDEVRGLGLPPLVLAPFDLTDYPQIERMGGLIASRFGRLDILVGAAAVLGGLQPMTHVDPPVFDAVVAANLTSAWRLLRTADPLLRRSDAGRAIFVTSSVARLAPAYWGPYAVTKAALETMIRVYAAEIAVTPVRANLIDPGVVRTRMRSEAFPGEDPETLPPPESVVATFIELALPACTSNGAIVYAQR